MGVAAPAVCVAATPGPRVARSPAVVTVVEGDPVGPPAARKRRAAEAPTASGSGAIDLGEHGDFLWGVAGVNAVRGLDTKRVHEAGVI